MRSNTRLLYGIATTHSLGGLTVMTAAIVLGWPWPVYLVAVLALVIAFVIATVASPA